MRGAAFTDHNQLPLRLRFRLIEGMELRVCDFMDGRLYGLNLAHTLLNGNTPVFQMVISLCTTGNVLKPNRDGGNLTESFKECRIILYGSFQLIHHNIGKLLTLSLGNIKNADHLESRTHDFDHLCDRLTVRIQHRFLRLGIDFFHLHLRLIGGRSKNPNASFSLHHMTVKIPLPCGIPGNQSGFRFLHGDEQSVVEGIIIELGHCAKIFLESFRFKQLLDALFQLVCDLTDLLRIFVFSQSMHLLFG